jgi:hypothetical protein
MPQTLPLATTQGVNVAYSANKPAIVVVDGFYEDPDAIRALALGCDYHTDADWFKGERSTQRYLFDYVRERFCLLLCHNVEGWLDQPYNGVFQKTTKSDPLVYHADTQRYAGAVYLNPGGGPGTSFWSRRGNRRDATVESASEWTDRSKWDPVETVAGLYNRLVLWDAGLIHSAECYDDDRLVQLFFFD